MGQPSPITHNFNCHKPSVGQLELDDVHTELGLACGG
uniref:Uncharacterized protein n=1 Tax=Rhizophora mucronata TaxID=61149 RepID=A0A2P2N3N0_RHIMU